MKTDFKNLQSFMDEVSRWSDDTFDNGNFISKLTMEDLHEHIKEKAEELCNQRFELAGKIKYGDIYKQGIIAGANFILYKWQESERWRKVEEELPEIEEVGVSVTVQIRVNLKSKTQDLTTVLEGFYDYDVEGWFLLMPLPKRYKTSIIEWKPIK